MRTLRTSPKHPIAIWETTHAGICWWRWTLVRNVDFGQNGASQFTLHAKGSGTLEIRLISRSTKPSVSVEFSSTGVEETTIDLDPEKFKGVKNVYFVVTSSTNANIDSWQFTEAASTDIQTPASSFQPSGTSTFYDLSGRRLPSAGASGTIVIERYFDQQGVVHTRKRMWLIIDSSLSLKLREFSPEKHTVVCLKNRPHYSRQSVAGGMDVPSVPNVEGPKTVEKNRKPTVSLLTTIN